MSQPEVMEGTWEQILSRDAARLAERRITLYVAPDALAEPESLQAAAERISGRTPEQIAGARRRLLAASPPPQDLPDGQTVLDAVMGHWPGDESDEEINAALERLS